MSKVIQRRTSSGQEGSLAHRELALKEADLELRRQDLQLRQEVHLRSRWANPLVIAILAAGLAAAANVWVSQNSGENAVRLERQKWEQAIQSEKEKSLAQSVTDLAKMLSRGYQQASWLLWKKLYDPKNFNQATVAAYDLAMKEILPSTLAAHMQIAAQDPALYRSLAPLVTELGQTDAAISLALVKADLSPTERMTELKRLEAATRKSFNALGPRISDVYVNKSEVDTELQKMFRDVQEGKRLPPRTRSAPR